MSANTPNLGLFKYDPSTDGAQTFNIQKALNENWDKLDSSILLALAAAAPYSTSKTYSLGTYCTRGAKLYKCTTAITSAETWTAGHWTETSIAAELIEIYKTLANKAETDLSNVSNETMKSKIESSGFTGGILPQIIVTAQAGSNITCTKGTTVLTAQEVSGTWTFNVPEYGEWTVSSGTDFSIVVVDTVKQFCTVIADPVLENNSWDIISAISKSGQASSKWSVGDTKNIAINGVSYTAQIIGFNHDTKTAGDKAGITFQLVDCLNTTYQMNGSNTNVGGWKSSAMRSRMSEFLGQLDDDLQNVIKAVNKQASIGNKSSTIETVSDKLFLLSEIEIFGSTTYSFAGEGSQYDWYKAGNTKVKKVNGSAVGWWERSSGISDTVGFCAVTSTGSALGYSASTSNGVSFGFCV